MHLLIRDFRRASNPQVAATHGSQERALDAGAVHFLDVLLESEATPMTPLDSHLVSKTLVGGGAAFGDDLRRVHVDDNIHGAEAEFGAGRIERISGRGHGKRRSLLPRRSGRGHFFTISASWNNKRSS